MAQIAGETDEQPGQRSRESGPAAKDRGSSSIMLDALRGLSRARSIEQIATVVRSAARELLGADGATFVLKQGDEAYYLDEDAIAPLWKGRRFPASSCISGLAMERAQQIAIPSIQNDDRIPMDLYRDTFVQSMVMTPVRKVQPVAAIGTYWAHENLPEEGDLALLQDLADATALAIENVQLLEGLERRVEERTAQLSALNAELESFAHIIAHDLRSPLSVVLGFGTLIKDRGVLPEQDPARDHLDELLNGAERMESILRSLLAYTRLAKVPLHLQRVDVSSVARDVADRLLYGDFRDRQVELQIDPTPVALADASLVDTLLEKLLRNALQYTPKGRPPSIRVGALPGASGPSFFVADNGVGIEPKKAERLFSPQRGSAGTAGLGLATCARIVRRHDGRIWAESSPEQGATIFFTLALPQVGS